MIIVRRLSHFFLQVNDFDSDSCTVLYEPIFLFETEWLKAEDICSSSGVEVELILILFSPP